MLNAGRVLSREQLEERTWLNHVDALFDVSCSP